MTPNGETGQNQPAEEQTEEWFKGFLGVVESWKPTETNPNPPSLPTSEPLSGPQQPATISRQALTSYLGEMEPLLNRLDEIVAELAKLLTEGRWYKTGWCQKVAIEMGKIKDLAHEVKLITPPEIASNAHEKYLQCFSRLCTSGSLIEQLFNNYKVVYGEAANKEWEIAIATLVEADAMIESLLM